MQISVNKSAEADFHHNETTGHFLRSLILNVTNFSSDDVVLCG